MDDMEKDDNSSKLSVNSYESININNPPDNKLNNHVNTNISDHVIIDFGDQEKLNLARKRKSSTVPEAHQKMIEKIASDLIDVLAWVDDLRKSPDINMPQARKEIDKDQKKQEKTAKSSEAKPPNQEEDRSGKNKNADQEQIKLQNDAEEKLRLVKNLIENARQAMVYGHYSSAETLLNQALSLLGSNPILRGSALEKKVNSIRSEAIEVQSGYDSSTFKASMSASAAFPAALAFSALEQHISEYTSSHYHFDHQFKARINTSRETIRSGNRLNDSLLTEYIDYVLSEDNDVRKKHINNLSSAIKTLEQNKKDGVTTSDDLEKLMNYKKELAGEKLDYKAYETFKELANKNLGSQDLSAIKDHLLEKLTTPNGKEELHNTLAGLKKTNLDYKNLGREMIEKIKSIGSAISDKIKFSHQENPKEKSWGNMVPPYTPNSKEKTESKERSPRK